MILRNSLKTAQKRDAENLNPHKAAVAAMWLFGGDYSRQSGGSMDFWRKLPKQSRELCRRMVQEIAKAKPE